MVSCFATGVVPEVVSVFLSHPTQSKPARVTRANRPKDIEKRILIRVLDTPIFSDEQARSSSRGEPTSSSRRRTSFQISHFFFARCLSATLFVEFGDSFD